MFVGKSKKNYGSRIVDWAPAIISNRLESLPLFFFIWNPGERESAEKADPMKTQDCDANARVQPGSALSKLAWLVAGVGIGAAAGMLLAPQSGEDTREWIATKCKDGIDTVNSQVKKTSQQVGDWIDESQDKVSEAVTAGQKAYSKAKANAS
jgi:gas vesicle protein